MAVVGRVLKLDDGNKNVIDIHLPFLNKERLYILPNKKGENSNEPDFNVFGLYGKVGAIWNRVSEKQNPYKSMRLETAIGNINFAIYPIAEEDQKKEDNGLKTHIVLYSVPRARDTFNDNNNSSTPGENKIPEIDIDEDEIPF